MSIMRHPRAPEITVKVSRSGINARPTRRRVAIAGMLAMAMLAAVTSSANAASWSPYIPPNRTSFHDCEIKVGPVYDPGTYMYANQPVFAVIGGVNVNCTKIHDVIKVQVWEAYKGVDGRWYFAQGGRGQWWSNSKGFGNPQTNILTTNPVCGNTRWYTAAWITLSGLGTKYVTSTPAGVDAKRGCGGYSGERSGAETASDGIPIVSDEPPMGA